MTTAEDVKKVLAAYATDNFPAGWECASATVRINDDVPPEMFVILPSACPQPQS